MSFDRHLEQVCPHTVREELLFVGEDFRTVRPVRPIASTNSVVVRLNGTLDSPSHGVLAPGSSEGNRLGPFQVRLGQNDSLAVRVNGGAVQTALVPSSNQMTAKQMSDHLNRSLQGVTFYETKGRLGFRTNLSGPNASVFFESSSTLCGLVGIAKGREYRGRNVLPGWTLIYDVGQLSDRPTRLLVFDEPLKGFNDFVEIDYTTLREECRRCGGSGVEYDWRYASDGSTGEVRDEALLLQEIQKIIYTVEGSNPFHAWYGSHLLDQIGKKLVPGGFIQNLITQDIYTAFARWQSIKKSQEEFVRQFVSDREFPFRLVSVDLQQSVQDPTVLFVDITVQNRSGGEVIIKRGLKLPSTVDLLNASTGSQQALRESLRNFSLMG